MTRRPAICAILAAFTLPAVAVLAQGTAPKSFTVVESGASFASLQDAVNAVGNTRATIRIAPGTYRQCAVQEEGIEGVICGRSIYEGTINLAEAQARADELSEGDLA